LPENFTCTRWGLKEKGTSGNKTPWLTGIVVLLMVAFSIIAAGAINLIVLLQIKIAGKNRQFLFYFF
jgi:hypothetical protein